MKQKFDRKYCCLETGDGWKEHTLAAASKSAALGMAKEFGRVVVRDILRLGDGLLLDIADLFCSIIKIRR